MLEKFVSELVAVKPGAVACLGFFTIAFIMKELITPGVAISHEKFAAKISYTLG